MGVDFMNCGSCGEIFSDCDEYYYCTCDEVVCKYCKDELEDGPDDSGYLPRCTSCIADDGTEEHF